MNIKYKKILKINTKTKQTNITNKIQNNYKRENAKKTNKIKKGKRNKLKDLKTERLKIMFIIIVACATSETDINGDGDTPIP